MPKIDKKFSFVDFTKFHVHPKKRKSIEKISVGNQLIANRYGSAIDVTKTREDNKLI